MTASRLQHALASGKPVWGGWITGPTVIGPEEFARAGYDYVGFDAQHGYIDDADIAVMLRRLEHLPIGTAVRLPNGDAAPIGRVLDAGADAIIVAMIPYQDSNMLISPGRFLVYDAQNFATNPDGSKRLQVIWDSENWGPEHAFTHPKFNRPIVWKGRIYRPTYNGQLDVYGLTN